MTANDLYRSDIRQSMTDDAADDERLRDTGQRSHKGPAILNHVFRKTDRKDRLRERDRLKAELKRREREDKG